MQRGDFPGKQEQQKTELEKIDIAGLVRDSGMTSQVLYADRYIRSNTNVLLRTFNTYGTGTVIDNVTNEAGKEFFNGRE